jgi:hypothetical protein
VRNLFPATSVAHLDLGFGRKLRKLRKFQEQKHFIAVASYAELLCKNPAVYKETRLRHCVEHEMAPQQKCS